MLANVSRMTPAFRCRSDREEHLIDSAEETCTPRAIAQLLKLLAMNPKYALVYFNMERCANKQRIAEGLKEIKLGNIHPLPDDSQDLAALTKALKERQLDIVRVAGETGHWDAIPDSEQSIAFRKRVVETLDEIASKHIGQRIIAFAHGGVINAYIAEVLGLQKDFFFPAANTSITIVRASYKHRVLYVLNYIGHIMRTT